MSDVLEVHSLPGSHAALHSQTRGLVSPSQQDAAADSPMFRMAPVEGSQLECVPRK